MKNGAELYRKIAEDMRKKERYTYKIGTHRIVVGDKTWGYRIKIHRYTEDFKGRCIRSEDIYNHDFQLTDLCSTRAKIVAMAKMDAGLWRTKAEVYSY